MSDSPFDGDGYDRRPQLAPIAADGHGKAALLLVESLIHGLIANSVLTVADAIEIIDTAADVERDSAPARSAGDGADPAIAAPSLLVPLSKSLGFDLKD